MSNQKMLHSQQITKLALALLVTLMATIFFSHKVEAETIFEGYYKVVMSGAHAGYLVQRYEFDDKKKRFASKYFLYVRLNADSKQYLNESLVTECSDDFQPIQYKYSKLLNTADPTNPAKMKTLVSTIDASFKKVMVDDFQTDANGRRVYGKNRKPIKVKTQKTQVILSGIKDGKNFADRPIVGDKIFLSNYLLYLMLNKGFQVGRGFSFEAFAEESADVAKGQVQIKSEEVYHNVPAYKIDWSYKDMPSISYVSLTGEALATETTAQETSQELVATKEEAVGQFTFPEKSIKATFGNIPDGKLNAIYKASQAPLKMPTKPIAPKKPIKSATEEN